MTFVLTPSQQHEATVAEELLDQGAGDASVAGFLAAVLHGLPPVDALLTAVGVGASSVEAPDSLSGVRDWEETRARIESRWEQAPLELKVPGWSWDQAVRLWVGPHDTGAGFRT